MLQACEIYRTQATYSKFPEALTDSNEQSMYFENQIGIYSQQ